MSQSIRILSTLMLLSATRVVFADCSGLDCLTSSGGVGAAALFGQSTSSSAALSNGNSGVTVPPIQALSGIGGSNGVSITNNSSNNNVSNPLNNPPLITPRPPVIPNAFQRNVQIRTGVMFEQYGYSFFNQPNTYTPVSNVPVDDNYTIGPGDEVSIRGWGSINVDYTATVASDGTIFIPKVGTFNITGVKAKSLNSYLTSKFGSVFKKFDITANVSKIRLIQVNVAGYAQVPGTYTLSSLTTLSNAIFAVGGPGSNGSLRHVELRRNGVTIKDFDMYQVLLKGNSLDDVRLLPGDIIYFKPKGNEVAIYDGVKFPAIYEAKSNETVDDILKFAGGTSFDNSKTKVVVEHTVDNKIIANDYSYQDGLKQVVGDADIVFFMLANKQYDQTVVLIGNVANPTRVKYHDGLTVQDVIPNKEALLTSSFWNSYSYNTYGKDHVLNQTGLEKSINRAGSNVAGYSSTMGLAASKNQSYDSTSSINDRAIGYSNLVGGESTAIRKANNQSVFSNQDNLLVAGPINIPEANINWNYASIIRIDPKDYSSHVIAFDLAKAIDGDPDNNIKLQAGDVINILSSKDVRNPLDYFPVFVFVDGEVKKPGVYEMMAGESLIDVISRAGGLTSKAYLFGMEVDRVSVQSKQQVVLNQMLDQAQQSLLSQSASAGVNAVSPVQLQMQAQTLQQQQALIEKMRQIKPAGRVVLKIKNNNATLNDLPHFVMENADTVYIPPRPNTVDVIGQVYNPSTFNYEKSLTISDYIEQAGTENEFADISHEYVLQANGILYSRKQAGWFGSFAGRGLNPGDTIIVPQLVQFGSTLQNVMNWTQILANFGTSAAAIQVFK